jgi:sulfoxide reductase heme-binding subunit YedZ
VLEINKIHIFISNKTRKVKLRYLYLFLTLPAILLIVELLFGKLGVDPMREIEKELGETALKLLIVTLSLSPISKLTSINFIRFRRSIGLMSFFYICLHFLTWLILDMQLRWDEVIISITKKPFILLGMISFILLIPLAITSNKYFMMKLGNAWSKLHRIVYLAIFFAGIHFLMMAKTIELNAVIYFLIILLLLSLRLVKLKKIRGLK